MTGRSLRMDLLDQQLVDVEGRPVGRVDDVVLDVPEEGGPPRVTGVVTGMQALGERLGGGPGALAARVARRLRDDGPSPPVIGVDLIARTGSLVRLRVGLQELPDVAGLERWLAEHLIGQLPGTGDARD